MTISHTTERKFFFFFFYNRARQNRREKMDSYSKEERAIKRLDRGSSRKGGRITRSRAKTRERIRGRMLLVLLYGRPIAASYLRRLETIHQAPGANNLRSRPRLSSYECHNLRERHDLTSMPPRGYLFSK